jgi:hypothetical protein
MARKNHLRLLLSAFALSLLSARLLHLLLRLGNHGAQLLRADGLAPPHPGSLERRLMPYQFKNNEEYKAAFLGKKGEEALKHSLETRKFEIELYWKRATYFWTFIAAALAAYGVIRASKDIRTVEKAHLSVLVSVLGFVFSFAWQAVNRGSKHWQENWENHVAILEDDVIGPLYKTVSKRPRATDVVDRIGDFLTGPRDYSVSKINQLVSLFVTAVWAY